VVRGRDRLIRLNKLAGSEAYMQPIVQEIEADLLTISSIAGEIIEFTGQPPVDVWRRLALEMEANGTNVIAETKKFGVVPFVFNDAMIEFYNKSDGFIYETMVESRTANRRAKWQKIIEFLTVDPEKPPGETSILLYGDSVGTDSIYLKKLGYNVVYHDFDSYCAQFAKFRFQRRKLTVPKFSQDPNQKFDYVICLEVAEHVPEPPKLVEELSMLLRRPNGVCLFSESFWLMKPQFPTHVATNTRYIGKTDELFLAVGMRPIWRDPHEKPIAYAFADSRPHYDPFPIAPHRSLSQRIKGRLARAMR
jgi:SAM-dependent methyltransferase